MNFDINLGRAVFGKNFDINMGGYFRAEIGC
jgi:hypothetical protein